MSITIWVLYIIGTLLTWRWNWFMYDCGHVDKEKIAALTHSTFSLTMTVVTISVLWPLYWLAIAVDMVLVVRGKKNS